MTALHRLAALAVIVSLLLAIVFVAIGAHEWWLAAGYIVGVLLTTRLIADAFEEMGR